ncbi:hypothetical protein LguiB_030563 [Lonicera macranthoides]
MLIQKLWFIPVAIKLIINWFASSNCFKCGQPMHWVKNCPWKETVCPNGCPSSRKLWTSKQERSYGRTFLKFVTCAKFEWLETAHAQGNQNNTNLKVKIEISLDELCKSFESKCIRVI